MICKRCKVASYPQDPLQPLASCCAGEWPLGADTNQSAIPGAKSTALGSVFLVPFRSAGISAGRVFQPLFSPEARVNCLEFKSDCTSFFSDSRRVWQYHIPGLWFLFAGHIWFRWNLPSQWGIIRVNLTWQELLLKAEARNLMIQFGPKHLAWKVLWATLYLIDQTVRPLFASCLRTQAMCTFRFAETFFHQVPLTFTFERIF